MLPSIAMCYPWLFIFMIFIPCFPGLPCYTWLPGVTFVTMCHTGLPIFDAIPCYTGLPGVNLG